MKSLTLIAAALALAGSARADVVRYDFNDWAGDLLAAAAVPAHLTASRFDVGNPSWGGLCWNFAAPSGGVDMACGGFGSSVANFTVGVEAGYRFDVAGLRFDGYGIDEYGPTAYAVYTSLDGFATALIGGSLLGQVAGTKVGYDAGLAASDLSAPLEIRIVSSGRDGLPASAWLLDNIVLDVTVEAIGAVPEPGSGALLGAALLAAGVTRRRGASGR